MKREDSAATMAGGSGSFDSFLYPNKRQKTVINPQPELNQELSKLMEESCSVCCGICLSEVGRSIRGQIDSCCHYFCFICIMEWSKIESRCPMCKMRFTSIRRLPKDGVFSSERIINVPKRDQVYNGLGNASIGPVDPYGHVSCSVCNSNTDEALLLLCDLCDMAAHTYCVGLGATVPECDWFCHDCTVSRAEHNNTEIDTGGGSQDVFGNSKEHNNAGINIDGSSRSMFGNSESEDCNADIHENTGVIPPTDAHVSIFDIVHEELDSSRRQIASSLPNLPLPSVVSRIGSGRTNQNNANKPSESGTRTLQLCRNVHSSIRAIRENWNQFQRGTLSFDFSSNRSGGESGKRHNISMLLHDRSGQPQSSSSQSFEHGLSGDNIQDKYRSSLDVNKAWKMMKIAKSISLTHGRAIRVHQASNHPSVNGYASKKATNTSSSINIVKKQQSNKRDVRSIQMEKHYGYYSNKRKILNRRSPKSKLQEQRKVMAVESCVGHPTSPQLVEPLFSANAHNRSFASHLNEAKPLAENVYRASSSVANQQGGSSCSINSVGSLSGSSKLCNGNPDLNTSSSSKIDTTERKDMLEKGHMKSKAGKDDDAKREIQSLVKLNLKLLSRDKKLEIDKFKRVARLATYTILAACGLEHRKSGIYTFPTSVVCNHTEDIKQLHRSTLLPNSCRECFYVFVKDVVQSIMSKEV